MDAEEAVSGQQSTISSAAADPLVDARCPQCGYSLRGLPENRCPECGRPFDPAEFTGTFLPRWPQLMAWYLAACIVAQLLEFTPALLQWDPSGLLAERMAIEPFKDAVNVTHLASAAIICLLGPVCVVGLCRRQDWGRKGCILVFAAGTLAAVSYFDGIWQSLDRASDIREAIHACAKRTAAAAEGVEPALLAFFLLTGLRRRTLVRKAGQPARLPPSSPSQRKRDWPLLITLVFLGSGTALMLAGWSTLDAMKQPSPFVGVGGRTWTTANFRSLVELQMSVGLVAVVAAMLIASDPSLTRWLTTGAVVLIVGVRSLELGVYYAVVTRDSFWTICFALRIIADALPYLTLVLFVLLAIRREDSVRLSRQV